MIDGGKPERDVVTDEDYGEAVTAQDATLFAQGRERKVLGKIRSRLVMGARDGGVRYFFDEERGIVRRREQQETGS
jgi:hypothetical protein